MRDLDRFSKRNAVHRTNRYENEAGASASWFAIVSRLLVVILVVTFFGWCAWEIYQPANTWISKSEIRRTESDVLLIHQDAEKARKEMAAPREVTVESLIFRCMSENHELSEDERALVRKNWSQFLSGSKISDAEGILFRMKMRYDANGEVEDFPLDEWEKKNAELEKSRNRNSKEDAIKKVFSESALEFAEKDGNAEEEKTQARDKIKKKKYENRSNRELVRDLVKEINENFYEGTSLYENSEEEAKPAEETQPDAETKPAEETKPDAETKPAEETKPDAETQPAEETQPDAETQPAEETHSDAETNSEVPSASDKNLKENESNE